MIVVTGAAGFIGSAVVWQLNENGITDIILSDKLHSKDKWRNIAKRKYSDWVDRDELFSWLNENGDKVTAIIHMGACSATTEKNVDFLMKNNYEYTKKLWEFSAENDISFIYASSAATYGAGEFGYSDNHELVEKYMPLNPYGYSKQIFDLWALKQEKKPKQWAGLKFFNVYGPNEYHKDRMASVIYHIYNQVKETGKVKLFKSYKEEYEHGGQLRDFVYVKDITDVIAFLIENSEISGIFNVGAGKARTFNDLAKAALMAMNAEENIEYIEMPEDIRDKYQYFTEADITKLRKNGYNKEMYSLEKGVEDYVKNYLLKSDKYL